MTYIVILVCFDEIKYFYYTTHWFRMEWKSNQAQDTGVHKGFTFNYIPFTTIK